MEINNTQNSNKESVESSKHGGELINVRAIISCPNSDYKRKFRNQFPRAQLELLVVAVKVFEFMTCPKCGEILKLDLEFNV